MINTEKFIGLPGKIHLLYQLVLHESAKTWVHRKSDMYLGGPESIKNTICWIHKNSKVSLTCHKTMYHGIYKSRTFKTSILTRPPQNIVNPFKPWDLNSSAFPFSEAN